MLDTLETTTIANSEAQQLVSDTDLLQGLPGTPIDQTLQPHSAYDDNGQTSNDDHRYDSDNRYSDNRHDDGEDDDEDDDWEDDDRDDSNDDDDDDWNDDDRYDDDDDFSNSRRQPRVYAESRIDHEEFGSDSDDDVTGDDRNETHFGLTGDDHLRGNGGDDWLFGNQGRDDLTGGSGIDVVCGGRDDDLVAGEDGDDWLFGNLDADSITGGSGSDLLFGGRGDDSVDGGVDNDALVGERGRDVLTGGDGSDTFVIQRILDDSGSGGSGSQDAGTPDSTGDMTGAPVDNIDIITDFQVGVDQLGLADNLNLTDLSWSDGSGVNTGQTIISYIPTGETIAILDQYRAADLSSANFSAWTL